MKKKPKKTDRSRGQIIQRGDGKFLVRFYVGRGPEGRRKYSSRIVLGNFRAAEKELTRIYRELDTRTFIEPSKQTLGEYLEAWLESTARITVSPRTYEDYAHRLRKDVIPQIGQRRLDQLTMQDVQRCCASMVAAGLSPRTVRYSFSVLKQALKKAVIAGLLFRNPADHVDLPRHVRREMSVLLPTQVNRFLAVTKGTDWHALWSVLLLGGLRPGEALGLKWSDLEGNRLQIARALKKGPANTFILAEPKTASSRRFVPLSKEALEALDVHRKRQAAAMLQAGPKFARTDLIFPNSVGQPMDIAKVRRLFKAAIQAAGLQRPFPYG